MKHPYETLRETLKRETMTRFADAITPRKISPTTYEGFRIFVRHGNGQQTRHDTVYLVEDQALKDLVAMHQSYPDVTVELWSTFEYYH